MKLLPIRAIATFFFVNPTQRGKTMYLQYTKVVFLLLLVTLMGCGLPTPTPTPVIHKGYVGENQPVAEVAIVRAVSAAIHTIDGEKLNHPLPEKYYKEVYLPPGQHTITLWRREHVGAWKAPEGYVELVSKPFPVNMEGGHIYELHGDYTNGLTVVTLWIEDSATGVIVAREVGPSRHRASVKRKTNVEIIEENRLKLEAQCKAQPERC